MNVEKLLNLKPAEKRGGIRAKRVPRKRPVQRLSPQDFYKQGKSKGIFAKRLTDYRFVIATDLEADDIAGLIMFAAWVNVNVRAFEDRNNFPIYAIIIGETQNTSTKYKRATEFLYKLADDIGWTDPEHHLYKQYLSATRRIWFDHESDTRWENEQDLVEASSESAGDDDNEQDTDSEQSAGDDSESENMYEPSNLADCLAELTSVKPGNIFYIWMKPFYRESFGNYFDIISQSPTIACGDFPNIRAPLVRVPHLGHILDPQNSRNLFKKLDGPAEDTFAQVLESVLLNWNDNFLNIKTAELADTISEFNSVDFDDYQEVQRVYESTREKLTGDQQDLVEKIIQLVKNDGKQLVCGDQLVIVAMLLACGTLQSSPFKIAGDRLIPKSNEIKQRQFLEAMLCAGLDLVD